MYLSKNFLSRAKKVAIPGISIFWPKLRGQFVFQLMTSWVINPLPSANRHFCNSNPKPRGRVHLLFFCKPPVASKQPCLHCIFMTRVFHFLKVVYYIVILVEKFPLKQVLRKIRVLQLMLLTKKSGDKSFPGFFSWCTCIIVNIA